MEPESGLLNREMEVQVLPGASLDSNGPINIAAWSRGGTGSHRPRGLGSKPGHATTAGCQGGSGRRTLKPDAQLTEQRSDTATAGGANARHPTNPSTSRQRR